MSLASYVHQSSPVFGVNKHVFWVWLHQGLAAALAQPLGYDHLLED